MMPGDWVIIGFVVAIAIADVALIICKTPTISRRFRGIGYRLSFFPYAWGVLGGHFWGPHLDPLMGRWLASVAALVLIGLLLSGFHWALRTWADPPDWVALLYLPCGVAAGIMLWPQ